jgi:hypothetical protein
VSFFFGIVSSGSLYFLVSRPQSLKASRRHFDEKLSAPYFAVQGKAAEEEVKKLGGTTISSDDRERKSEQGQGKAKSDRGFRQKKA